MATALHFRKKSTEMQRAATAARRKPAYTVFSMSARNRGFSRPKSSDNYRAAFSVWMPAPNGPTSMSAWSFGSIESFVDYLAESATAASSVAILALRDRA